MTAATAKFRLGCILRRDRIRCKAERPPDRTTITIQIRCDTTEMIQQLQQVQAAIRDGWQCVIAERNPHRRGTVRPDRSRCLATEPQPPQTQ